MSDLRFDPISGQWIAIARNRLQRPTEFIPIERVQKQLICPFCAGNEEETPPAIATYDAKGKQVNSCQPWMVRVVPNKYPSFFVSDHPQPDAGPYDALEACGQQELIIPSSRHVTSLSGLTAEEMKLGLVACQHRIQALQQEEGLRHTMLFLNCRSAAGASLAHIHLQLIASPVVSDYLRGRVQRNQQSIREQGQPLISRLSAWESQQGQRMVADTASLRVFCPYASRFPFQLYIVPKQGDGPFTAATADQLEELGHLLRMMVGRYESVLESPAYNLLLHSAPFDSLEYDQWYFELFPRITSAAGLEWGTDIWVNPVTPETAAKALKQDRN